MDAPVRSHTRILALYAAAALASSLKDQAGLILAQSNLNNYRSRGHGKENTMSVSFASKTNRQTRSKYMPHVGKKEIARHNRTLDFYGVRQLCHRDKTLLDNARRFAKRTAWYGLKQADGGHLVQVAKILDANPVPERTPEEWKAIREANGVQHV